MLLIQDTTELDYSHQHKQGMGRLSGEGRQGLKVHSTLCANTSGVPMGLIGQKVWAREKKHRSLEKEGHIKDVEKR
ncbi:MAG: IS4 family transposase, partial [Spirulinaceae cyanobacterium]